MVHAKIFGGVLERSLPVFSILVLLLLALGAPAPLVVQTANGQSAQMKVGKNGENGPQIQLSPAFLNGRTFTQNAGFSTGDLSQVAAGIIQQPAAPVYDVVALRVSFQADTSRFTTGDGTFTGALFDTLQSTVDPLPHNADYFDAHLQFLANYVSRVSDGKTQLNTHLIPEEIQVSQPMAAYSPTGLEASSDAELTKLAGLVEEAWALANQQSSFDMSGFDPATTAFVMFHAGVGRDIELVGTSLEKTPQDLPTIFFNDIALERLLPGAEISFNGFPVEHTILMPRTESRVGFDFIQDIPFLVEFSINGLLAASFFNFLEVPDLFNTATGESAIGPFGLMDPLGLFAYNGLFPPEPSAWTKLYLGWADLVDVDASIDQTISLSAVGALDQNEIARVPISASEYFLVENRDRDVEDDGLTLTIFRDGQTFTQQIANGDEEFNSINIDGFDGGVVVDADDFDWALPGGIDADDNQLTGGILIWHIDERILAEGLAENRVNVDLVRRGVDLEEADGAQDIGFPSDNIFGPQAFLGSPFDFFYEGNPIVVINTAGEEIRLYNNRFGPATFPNSNSNADGLSFVVFEDFTGPGATMSFNYRRSTSTDVKPIDGFTDLEDVEIPVGSYLTSFPDAADGVIYQAAPGQIVVNPRDAPPSFITSHFVKSPVVLPDGRVAALAANPQREASLLLYENGETTRVLLDDALVHHLPSYYNQLLFDNLGNRLIALLDAPSGGRAISIDLNPANEFEITNLPGFNPYAIAVSNTNNDTGKGQVAILRPRNLLCRDCGKEWIYSRDASEDTNVGQLVFGEDDSGQVGAFVLIADNFNVAPDERLFFLRADESVEEINLARFEPAGASYEVSRFPILLDVDRDGRLEVLITYGPNLFAFSAGGGMVDGFPVKMPAAASTQPLVVSMEGETEWTVIVGGMDGYIYGYTLGDRIQQASGFPLAVGASITATPLIRGNILYAVDAEGAIKAWELVNLNSVWWGEQYGNLFNSSFVKAEEGVVEEVEERTGGGALLVEDENYNWPNPIRNGETNFRLFPSEDARVTITIIDVGGALIDKIEVENVRGGTSTDVLWQTDAASGLYFARVKAVAVDGTSETKLIRIAIVR